MTPTAPTPWHPFTNAGTTSGVCAICKDAVTAHSYVAYSWLMIQKVWGEIYCYACQRLSSGEFTSFSPCPFCQSISVSPVSRLFAYKQARQAPLFTLPPIAEATGWKIEFRWKDGEIDWATGSPKPTCWFPFSTYKDHRKAKNALRSLRYGQGRKLFRIAPFLFTHMGDIECHVPLPPEKPVPPKQGAGQGD